MGDANLDVEDACRQAQIVGGQDSGPIQGQNRDAARDTHLLRAVRHRGNDKPRVARFGGIPLTRRRTAILHDRAPGRNPLPRKEIVTRLQRGVCELCGLRGEVHVHHVAKLADLASPGLHQPEWARLMATRRRKTLVVCSPCHDLIHNDLVQATPLTT
ncbi:hypothetical protein [Kibdelosporangium aridum]|uniref:HNH endonuclease n=1 Tax=Kibdelosporangium aridum TaxID=2030 RepID=UPI0037BF1C05